MIVGAKITDHESEAHDRWRQDHRSRSEARNDHRVDGRAVHPTAPTTKKPPGCPGGFFKKT